METLGSILCESRFSDQSLGFTERGCHFSHLHGHKVMIVGRSQDYTSTDPTLNPPIVEGQANPIRRDTVQIPSGASATLRVVADNPGVWLFHCMSSLSPLLEHVITRHQVTSNGTFNPVSPCNLSKHLFKLKSPRRQRSRQSLILTVQPLTSRSPAMLLGTIPLQT